MKLDEVVTRRCRFAIITGLIISGVIYLINYALWAQAYKTSDEVEKNIMVYIELGELLIVYQDKQSKLEAEYGRESLQVKESLERWLNESKKYLISGKYPPRSIQRTLVSIGRKKKCLMPILMANPS